MVKNITDRSIGVRATFKKMEKAVKTQETEKKQEEKVQNKVSQIQGQIEKGEYKIDLKKTSEKMALNLLNI